MSKPNPKLLAKWYAKLKKSGFKDAERNEYQLKQPSFVFIDMRRGNRIESSVSVISRDAKREYYQLATNFLNDYAFANRLEEIIWEYHANGLSTREISETLNKVRRKKIGRMFVWHIVKRLRTAMKEMYGVK